MGDVHKTLWEDEQDGFPLEKSMTVTMFMLSPVETRDELKRQLQRCYDELMKQLEPWIRHYAWDYEALELSMCEHAGVDYVYGSLKLGEMMQDEWLVTSLLYKMTTLYDDLFIQVYDSEGDFLLIESWEHLPEWISPDVARNRVWLSQGRLLIIPEVYYMDRSLTLKESLTFLERASYRCLPMPDIDAVIRKRCDEYPERALQGQVTVEVEVERGMVGHLIKRNFINECVWEKIKQMSMMNTEYRAVPLINPQNVKVQMKVETLLLLKALLEKENSDYDLSLHGGMFLNLAIKEYLSKYEDLSDEDISDEAIEHFNTRGDELQLALKEQGIIAEIIEPVVEFDLPEQTTNEEDVMMEKLQSFFKDTEADVDGVVNGSMGGDGECESGSEDEDATARDFLENAGAGIDEDDFFEFFAKEALKLKDGDLDKFRNLNLDGNDSLDDDEVDNEEEEEEGEEYDFNDPQLTPEELQDSLQNLIKSLKEGMDGPTSTLLQNLH